MFTKWKQIKKEINITKKDIISIYKKDKNWKIHLRDENNVWIEFTFFMNKREVLGTYYIQNTEEEDILYNYDSF